MLSEEEVNKIVGEPDWQHSYHYCNCFDEAPEDPDAYMSSDCRSSYNRGIKARNQRIVMLMSVFQREIQEGNINIVLED